MKVFKFGGASLKNPKAIRNVVSILRRYKEERLFIVVSAFGKTTNGLEAVIKSIGKPAELEQNFNTVKDFHFDIMGELFEGRPSVYDTVDAIFEEMKGFTREPIDGDFDYRYDQIVSKGEVLSSTIVAAYLESEGLPTSWLDIRQTIRTDATYRDANVNWEVTEQQFQATVPTLLDKGFVLSQGFLGGTTEGATTTLGREGSDYTAAIASYCLNADSMSVWKDVPGILTADPRLFKNVTKIDRLSFREAIEMTYYGAKVIHPKTIKPLQNKSIPLFVKSFVNPDGEGTMISENLESTYPPVIVVEKNQALLQVSRRDFSFVAEDSLSQLFALFARHRVKVNMMQNTAIGFSICVNNVPERIQPLMDDLRKEYKVFKDSNMELITVRHYHVEILESLKVGKMIYLEERIRNTAKMVLKPVPKMERLDG